MKVVVSERAAGALGLVGALVIALTQACSSERVVGVAIGSVRVTPSSSTVVVGRAAQFEATVYEPDGSALMGAEVTWSSDQVEIATVNGDGLASGLANGTTNIRASFEGIEAAAALTVQPRPAIDVSPASVTFYAGAAGPLPDPTTLQVTNQGAGDVGTLALDVAYEDGGPGDWLNAALTGTTTPTALTIVPVSTELAAGKYRATVTVRSADADDGTAPIPVTLSLTAFTVTPSAGETRVIESGRTDSVTVVLDGAPSSSVTLTVISADTGEVTASPASLTFSATNWNRPQPVVVTGVADFEVDGDRTTALTFTVDDARSDQAYRPALDRRVSVTIVDGDAAGFTVADTGGSTTVTEAGVQDSLAVALRTRPASNVVILVAASDPGEATVAPTTLTFRPSDWDVPRTITVTGVDDAVVDGSQASTLTLRVDASRSDPTYRGLADQVTTVTTLDDDDADIVVVESQGSTVVTESGSIDAFTVVLTARPAADVVLDLTSADVGEVTVSPATLTFSPAAWSIPQPVSLRGVDDALIDGDVVTDVTVSIDSPASAIDYGSVGDETVAVTTRDDDAPGFTVAAGAATTVSEGGPGLGFTVVLTAQPTSNVVLFITSADSSEVVVSPATLTFPAGAWDQPQTVTVTGVDDDLVDGSRQTDVRVGVDVAASDDDFDGTPDQTVQVTVTDDDTAGVTASTDSLTVAEGGGSASLTIRLDAQPAGNVVLAASSADPGDVTVLPAVLTFTGSDWDTPQELTITAVNDDVIDGDRQTQVVIAVDSAQSDITFASVPTLLVTVTTTDNGVATPSPAGIEPTPGPAGR